MYSKNTSKLWANSEIVYAKLTGHKGTSHVFRHAQFFIGARWSQKREGWRWCWKSRATRKVCGESVRDSDCCLGVSRTRDIKKEGQTGGSRDESAKCQEPEYAAGWVELPIQRNAMKKLSQTARDIYLHVRPYRPIFFFFLISHDNCTLVRGTVRCNTRHRTVTRVKSTWFGVRVRKRKNKKYGEKHAIE